MAKTVWKYEVKIDDEEQAIDIPKGAECVMVDCTRNVIWAWYEVDPDAPKEPTIFRVFGTGHPIPDEFTHQGSVHHIITVEKFRSATLVWHLYTKNRAMVLE